MVDTTILSEHKSITPIVRPSASQHITVTQMHLASLRSKQSRLTRLSIFNNIARIFGANDHTSFDWLALKPIDINGIVAVLAYKRALLPTTVNSYISAIRSLFKTAYVNGLIDNETYQRIKSVENIKATRVTRNRKSASVEDIKALINHCESVNSAAGARDAAMIAVLASCGLRRAELASLNLSDFDAETGFFRVIGKGNKERMVPIPPTTISRILHWVDYYRGNSEGILFCRVRRHGFVPENPTSPLSGNSIYEMLKQRTNELNKEQIRPHSLRRFCGTTLLNAGRDLVLVRDYLGHESISTTQIYIEKDHSELHEAATSTFSL